MNIIEILIKAREILVSQWSTMLIVVVFFLFLIIAAKLKKKPTYKYLLKNSVMTPTELMFFETLLLAVDNKYHIFSQIHFDAILNNKIIGQPWSGAFRHINQKSVDFLICDLKTTRPLLAIELDDKTHSWGNRQARDFEEVRIFEMAGLPLLRKRVRENYDYAELAKEIESKIIKN